MPGIMRAAAVLAFVASVGAVGSCGSDDEAECTLTDCDGSCVEGTSPPPFEVLSLLEQVARSQLSG